MSNVIVAIDTKSLYYNFKRVEAEKGTATVAVPVVQGNTINEDYLKLIKEVTSLHDSNEITIKNRLLGNKRNNFKINQIYVFNNFQINGKIFNCESAYSIYAREDINPNSPHFNRIRLHYPISTKFKTDTMIVDNKKVLDFIKESLDGSSFIVTAFEIKENNILNFNLEVIGKGVYYRQVFSNNKGNGNKFLKLLDASKLPSKENFAKECITILSDESNNINIGLLENKNYCLKMFSTRDKIVIKKEEQGLYSFQKYNDSNVFEHSGTEYILTSNWTYDDYQSNGAFFYSWLINKKNKDQYYISPIVDTHYGEDTIEDSALDIPEDEDAIYDCFEEIPIRPKQEIYYGVSGTGKSFVVDQILKTKTGNDFRNRCVRVLFHPEYEYSDFVGTIRPIVTDDNKIQYGFVPGPMTKILEKCFNDLNNEYFLIIEELTRGNASAIIGDFFQLFDRNDLGTSKYEINNCDVANYLKKHTNFIDLFDETIFFPSNLNILCTMNIEDQNVFVLDTAFKRRFQMKYLPIDFSTLDGLENEQQRALYVEDNQVFYGSRELSEMFKGTNLESKVVELQGIGELKRNWKTFAILVNRLIDCINISNGVSQISEDKKLGPFFVIEQDFLDKECFVNKVVSYLKYDIFKFVDSYFTQPYEDIFHDLIYDKKDVFEYLIKKR